MQFKTVTIIGVGLLGGSLARDLKAKKICKRIVGVCRSQETVKYALDAKIVDEVLPIKEAVVDVDLIVFATPMQTMLPLLKQINDVISADTLITDVGSVKNELYEQLKNNFPERLKQFVLAHPIAGGEQTGVTASKLGLFDNKHLVIANTEEVSQEKVSQIDHLWQAVGAKVITMSLTEHDAIFAKTSHLPHVIAFTLVNFLNQQGEKEDLFEMAAAGFYDFTRIASSDAHMWRDICVTNREEIVAAIDGYQAQIDQIREYVNNADQESIFDYFAAAKAARNNGLEKKQSR